jgi:hypothetical protein
VARRRCFHLSARGQCLPRRARRVIPRWLRVGAHTDLASPSRFRRCTRGRRATRQARCAPSPCRRVATRAQHVRTCSLCVRTRNRLVRRNARLALTSDRHVRRDVRLRGTSDRYVRRDVRLRRASTALVRRSRRLVRTCRRLRRRCVRDVRTNDRLLGTCGRHVGRRSWAHRRVGTVGRTARGRYASATRALHAALHERSPS